MKRLLMLALVGCFSLGALAGCHKECMKKEACPVDCTKPCCADKK